MTRLGALAALSFVSACASAPATTMAPILALPPGASYCESAKISTSAAEAARWRIQQICEGRNDAQHVEQYDGEFGPSRAFVLAEAPATARLIWNRERVNAYAPYAGTLYGAACTGTLVAADLILTAAHCIEIAPNPRTNRTTPLRAATGGGYESIPPEDIGLLLDAQFDYQLAPDGRPRASVTFAVEKVIEHGINENRSIGVDYALLKLSPLADGRRAGDLFAPADWCADDESYDGAVELTIIQHPAGDFKKVHAGLRKKFPGAVLRQDLRYGSIDTLASSSGSGIIDQNGRLIGVHVLGGCQEAVLYNSGVSLVAVRSRSAFFRNE